MPNEAFPTDLLDSAEQNPYTDPAVIAAAAQTRWQWGAPRQEAERSFYGLLEHAYSITGQSADEVLRNLNTFVATEEY